MAHRDFDRALTSWVNAAVIEHLVLVIMDNLHIHRLRQLWKEIEASLPAARSEKLPRAVRNFRARLRLARTNGGSLVIRTPRRSWGKEKPPCAKRSIANSPSGHLAVSLSFRE